MSSQKVRFGDRSRSRRRRSVISLVIGVGSVIGLGLVAG